MLRMYNDLFASSIRMKASSSAPTIRPSARNASAQSTQRQSRLLSFRMQSPPTPSPLPDAPSQETTDMLAYYRSWKANHDAFAAELVPHHQDFWKWVCS